MHFCSWGGWKLLYDFDAGYTDRNTGRFCLHTRFLEPEFTTPRCTVVRFVNAFSYEGSEKKRKEKEKTTPFGVNLMRSQVLYQAAQKMACQAEPGGLTFSVNHRMACRLSKGRRKTQSPATREPRCLMSKPMQATKPLCRLSKTPQVTVSL